MSQKKLPFPGNSFAKKQQTQSVSLSNDRSVSKQPSSESLQSKSNQLKDNLPAGGQGHVGSGEGTSKCPATDASTLDKKHITEANLSHGFSDLTKVGSIAKQGRSLNVHSKRASDKSRTMLPQPSMMTKSIGRISMVSGMPLTSKSRMTEFATNRTASTAPGVSFASNSNGTRFPGGQGVSMPSSGSLNLPEDTERQIWMSHFVPRILLYLEANPDVDQALGLVIDRVCHGLFGQSQSQSVNGISMGPFVGSSFSAMNQRARSSGAVNSRVGSEIEEQQQEDRPFPVDNEGSPDRPAEAKSAKSTESKET